jgi:1-acyl-sn-glycerol-3-phosphate acyltransferase
MIFSGIYILLTIPVFGLLYIYTAIGVLIVIPMTWLNLKRPVQIMAKVWAKSVFMVMGKNLRIHGKENLDKNEKYILLANHASLFDMNGFLRFLSSAVFLSLLIILLIKSLQ